MKNMKRFGLMLLVMVFAVACIAGCSSPSSEASSSNAPEESSAAPETAAEESSAAPETSAETADAGTGAGGDLSDVSVGACVMSLQHEYMINLVKGYEEFQKQTGLDLTVTDGGNMEPEKQVTNVENFIEQGVDGVIVQAISINTMADTLNKAYDQGIKVAYYPKTEGVDVNANAYLAYDEYEWGSKLGVEAVKWINEKLDGKAKILSLETSLEENSILRAQGWKDVIAEELGDAVEIITVEAKASETAMSTIESALQANPDAQLVLSYNDEMGLGAYEAVVQSGLDTTNFFVGSCDGTDSVLDLVEQDTVFRCTIGNSQYVPEIGFYWLQNIVKACVGLDYEEAFPVETMAIDMSNIKEYRTRDMVFELDPALVEYMASK